MYNDYTPEPVKGMSTGAKFGIGCAGCLGFTLLLGSGLLVVGAVASSAGGGAIEASASPSPTPSQDETDDRPVEDEEPEETDVPDFQVDGSQVLRIILTSSWEELNATEKSEVCFGWGMDSEMLTDAFVEGFGTEHEEVITEEEVRQTVADFYNDKCE